MRHFRVIVQSSAQQDVARLNDYIERVCAAPLTARRYYEGLMARLRKLEHGAMLARVSSELSEQMGLEIRRANYKAMAILYSVDGDVVYIHRIIPQNMIIY